MANRIDPIVGLAQAGMMRSSSSVTPTLDAVEAALERLGMSSRRVWRGDKGRARCPMHGRDGGDRDPSLSVFVADDGSVQVKCWAGCTGADVWSAIRTQLDEHAAAAPTRQPRRDAFPSGWVARPVIVGDELTSDPWPGAQRVDPPLVHVASYRYTDPMGRLMGLVDRFEHWNNEVRLAKSFRPRVPVARMLYGRAWFSWKAPGRAVLPLFALPRLFHRAEGAPVYLVEGEKAALALLTSGYTATTCAGGAAGWRPEHTAMILAATREQGACIMLWRDNDDAGRRWQERLRAALAPHRALFEVAV